MSPDNRFSAAGEWLLRLQADDVQPDEFSAWMQWYESDPLNRAAFEEVQAALESARALPASKRDEWTRALLTQRAPAEPRSSLLSWWKRFAGSPGYRTSFASGALLVMAIGAAAWLTFPEPPQITAAFQTPVATHRTETLPDGSIVRIGARSSVSLSYSGETRYVVLESGEAFFTVAKDAARPFVVQAGPVSIRAVGTEFNVRRAGDNTTVAVSEGIVEVVRHGSTPAGEKESRRVPADVRLKAGEQVAMDLAGMPAVRPIQVAAVSAWQTGRLQFVNEPLRLVIATVNRYSSREVVVTDASLGDLRITGSLDGRDIDEWLRALPVIVPVRVVEVSKGTVLVSPAN